MKLSQKRAISYAITEKQYYKRIEAIHAAGLYMDWLKETRDTPRQRIKQKTASYCKKHNIKI